MNLRLFTAIQLPPTVEQSIDAICHGLDGARWTPSHQRHITLHFLGNVEACHLKLLIETLATVNLPPFFITLNGLGQFRYGKKARLLWIKIEENRALSELHQRLGEALRLAGFPSEQRKFYPHVTVARLKQFSCQQLKDWLQLYHNFRSRSFSVEKFLLFSSQLNAQGAQHSLQALFTLKKEI